MIHILLLISRQGKLRLSKWFTSHTGKEKMKMTREITALVLSRAPKMYYKIVYKRYASLYFVAVVDKTENELYVLEIIHHYVEVLDRYFSNAYYILDELLIAGELQESSKKQVLRVVQAQDALMEEAKEEPVKR